MSFPELIIELISKYGVWGIVIFLIFVIFYLVKVILDEDLSAVWRARVYKQLYKISGKSSLEKKYIENDICGRINLARRKMPFGKEHLPKAIRIEWIKSGKGEVTPIRESEIIIRLDPAEAQEKNVVLITNALVKQTSLVGIRYILEKPFETSVDLNLVKKLLEEIGNKKILDWYLKNEYIPTVEGSSEVKKWNEKLVEIDEKGLFTRLLLVELDEYSKRVAGKLRCEEMFEEIAGLVDFLYKISTKAYGQEVPLDYITRNIKTGAILVGETSKVLLQAERYLIAFQHKVKQQFNSIYIMVWDKEFLGNIDKEVYERFTRLTENLDQNILKSFKVYKDFELKYICTDYKGNRRKAKIIRYIPEYSSE
jgi:hypothetical protein